MGAAATEAAVDTVEASAGGGRPVTVTGRALVVAPVYLEANPRSVEAFYLLAAFFAIGWVDAGVAHVADVGHVVTGLVMRLSAPLCSVTSAECPSLIEVRMTHSSRVFGCGMARLDWETRTMRHPCVQRKKAAYDRALLHVLVLHVFPCVQCHECKCPNPGRGPSALGQYSDADVRLMESMQGGGLGGSKSARVAEYRLENGKFCKYTDGRPVHQDS